MFVCAIVITGYRYMNECVESSSEFEGSGVGLAIVKKVMQRHGGAVSMRGELNKGATITLTFRE